MTEHELDHRPIDADEKAVDRVPGFRLHPSPNEEPHQHRHERDGEQRRRRHRQRLGPREWCEQAALLGLQREDRQKAERNDQQRGEERGTHLLGGFDHQLPVCARFSFAVVPLHVLVEVFHHHDGSIDHHADGNRDPAQRHDVGTDPEPVHCQKSHQDPNRKRNDGDEGTRDVEEEDDSHDCDDDGFLDQLFAQIVNGPMN